MKKALVDDQLVRAAPDTPSTAMCPYCKSPVERRNRQGTWFWRHVKRPRGGCHPQQERKPGSEPTLTHNDNGHKRWRRQVGDLTVELYPANEDTRTGYLKLQPLGAKANGQPPGMFIRLSEVHSLAQVLLDIVAKLAANEDQE